MQYVDTAECPHLGHPCGACGTLDARFYVMDLDPVPHHEDVQTWLDQDLLIGVVDAHAGIIGYCHRDRAEQFVAALNALATTRGVTGDGAVGPA